MLNIVGNMADKIKNNLHQAEANQFSWKIKFPEEIPVGTISEDGLMILNSKTERVRVNFDFNIKENSVLLTPHREYTQNKDYFFIAKYQNKKGAQKEICMAFVITEENTMQTFDAKTSKDKLASITARIRAREEARAAKEAERTAREEQAPPAKKPNELILDDEDIQ